MVGFIILVGFIYCMQSSMGFQNGPPFSSCLTLFPKHGGLEAQTTVPPYTVLVDEDNYSPGQEIHITVRGNEGKPFKGVQITVHRNKGDKEELIGKFTEFPVDKLKALNCIDGQENVIVHKNSVIVTEVNITWTAPAVNEGNLTFHTSIVEKYDVFWINILNVLPSKIDVPVVTVLEVQNAEDVIIDYDKCGESMGCVLYPYYCTGENCDAGATFREEGNGTRFQLFAKNTEGYISIGLSDDRLMGDDHTITCTVSDDEYSVQHGYNPDYYNYRQYKKNEIQDMTVSMRDGKLYCEFTRPMLMSVVNMFNPTKRLQFDISNDYYVMIAWGYAHKGSTAVTHHIELPFITNSKVDFKSTYIYRGSALPTLTQVHGLLMMMSWVLFTGLATIIARYLKISFGNKEVCGVKVWFQSHRASAGLAAVITATSFIIIFVKVDGLTEVAETHAFVGIALMSATTLQVIGGLLRPDPKSDFRKIFNWGHWFTGKAAHILAAVTVFLAFNIKLIPKTQSLFGVTISIIWVVCQVLWEVFFEIRHRRRQSPETKEAVHLQKADIVLLFIYLINMLCVFAVAVMAIYFF